MKLETDAVKTNITLIDHQHQKYFAAVEKLMEQCQKKEPDMQMVQEILQQTQEYAVDNFDTEEYLMQLEKYPDIDEHTAKHEQFKKRLDSFAQQLKINRPATHLREMTRQLHALLVGWFNNQIKDDDMRMAAFLHARERNQ